MKDKQQVNFRGLTSVKKQKKAKNAWAAKKDKQTDMSDFDPITGEKIATTINNNNNVPTLPSRNNYVVKQKAKMEILADARKDQKKPTDLWEAAKQGTLGTTLGFLAGNVGELSRRHTGLLALGLGGIMTGMSLKKQLGNYNNEMAARETLLGQHTDRQKAYIAEIKNKYGIK